MYDLILYGNTENERGGLELCLMYENGVKITAEMTVIHGKQIPLTLWKQL